MSRIGFYQYERAHPNNAPHVGQCLLLGDLRRAGHDVDAALVPVDGVGTLIERIHALNPLFVGLDAIFTVPAVNAIKAACPTVPVLVGGNNALSLMLSSRADFAIVGPARRALLPFVDALAAGKIPEKVPNLFFRDRDGRVDHTGVHAAWVLDEDLCPYDPDLNWAYAGEGRAPSANVRYVSVVPEFGCAFRADAAAHPSYERLSAAPESPALAAMPLSERARDAIAPFLSNTKGCAFCTFRFQPYTIDATDRTVPRLLSQMAALHTRYGVTDFSIQSEFPFRFLNSLVAALRRDKVPVTALHLRTFPKVLAHRADAVSASIERAVDAGIFIRLHQLGFENFSQEELDHLGKGVTVEENVAAARALASLKRRFGDAIEVAQGHGFILFTPWTRPEDIVTNIDVIRRHAPFLAGAIGLHSRLCLYDPVNPIFRLAELDGLVVPSPEDYGFDFRFADPRTRLLTRLALALEGSLARTGAPRGPALSRAVLSAAAPLFVGARAGDPPDALYHTAERDARAALARDAEDWPLDAQVLRLR